MGFFSRFRSRRSSGSVDDPDSAPSLLRYRYEDPDFVDVERAAAADVKAVEQDEKFFDDQAPGDDPERGS
jgi:hypothetical protein